MNVKEDEQRKKPQIQEVKRKEKGEKQEKKAFRTGKL